METKKIELKILLSSVAIIILVEAAARIFLPSGKSVIIPVVGAARVVEVSLILLVIFFWTSGLSSIGLARDQILPGIIKGLIWAAGFGLAAALCMSLVYAAGINPIRLIQTSLPSESRNVVVYFIVGGLVAPAAEEIFFRGIIYGFFRRWGVLLALLISTLLFIAAHPGGAVLPLTQIAGGFVFALAYEIEGCLMVPILIHSLGNLTIFALTLFF
ncbi:MAG: CPBP family intramembrane metalloprotease [Deltaproteobacteria bacterium]|nr:CPBP family intramembrane metalloprotease [Deltaproteobacteria bacterium]